MGSIWVVLAQIFFLIFLGAIMRRRNLLCDEFQAKLSILITKYVLPFSILGSSNHHFDTNLIRPLITAIVLTILYYPFALFLSSKIAYKCIPNNRKSQGVFTCCSTFANVGFLGFPLVNAVFGAQGMIYAIIFNMGYNLFFYSIGTTFMQEAQPQQRLSLRLRTLLIDPAIITSVFTLLLYVSPFRFPKQIHETFDMVGGLMVPLSMFLMGASLIGIKPKQLLNNREAGLISLLRLVLFPALFLPLKYIFPQEAIVFSVIILLLSLPVGTLNTIFAKVYSSDVELASTSTVQSMLLMMISLPIWLTILAV